MGAVRLLTDEQISAEISARSAVIDGRWALAKPRLDAAMTHNLLMGRVLSKAGSSTQVEKLAAHGMKHPKIQLEAIAQVGIDAASSCAMLVNETDGGYSEWGHDPVRNPITGTRWVTKPNVLEYLKWRDEGLGNQGCGSTQLTSPGLQDEAMTLGGLWVVLHDMHIGFLFLHQLQKEFGIEGGFVHFNGSGPAAEAYGARAFALRNQFAAAGI